MRKKYSVTTFLMMINIVSFLGFCLEDIWLLITKGYMNNRNMTLPFLFGYGLAVVSFYLFIGTPDELAINALNNKFSSRKSKWIFYYIISFFAVSIAELILGTSVKKLFGFNYWNYTWLPLHFTKYTSVPTSLGFAFAATVFMGKFFTPIMDFFQRKQKKNNKIIKYLSIIIFILIIIDYIFSFLTMYKTRALNIIWKITVFPFNLSGIK